MTDETLWPHDEVTDWHVFISRAAKMLVAGITPLTYLFRGQPDATKPLVPTLLRHFPPDCTAEQVIAIEKGALSNFRSQAHLHYPQGSLPSEFPRASLIDWWALMQHHGAPTRLLDWTTSPYVAAYFACEKLDNKPGAIFVASLSSNIRLFKNSFPTDLPNKELQNPSALPLIFIPHLSKMTARLVAQQGHFTVSVNVLGRHGKLIAEAVGPLASANPKNLYFRRLVIPANQKPEFLKHLSAMNVTANALFPGADGLGRSVAETVRLMTIKMGLKNPKADSA